MDDIAIASQNRVWHRIVDEAHMPEYAPVYVGKLCAELKIKDELVKLGV